MAGVETVKVKEVDDGMRLNRWFQKYYPALTMGRLQKLLRTKQIKVNGKKVEAGYKVVTGEEVRVPPLDDAKVVVKKEFISKADEEFIKSMIIFKDDNIIVLNKPSGVAVQGGTNTVNHIDRLLEALKFGNEEKPKLVHRIDKNTSGLLVLARNRKYADLLTKAFREHSLDKTYLALVEGAPKQDSGEIKAPIDKVGNRNMVVEDGKKAVTTYEVLSRVGNKFALVAAHPLTGRTHQIRVHMEYMGTPIICDDKYFGEERHKFSIFENKLHLHAYKIDLSAIYNKRKIITAPIPFYFQKSLDAVGIDFKGIE